MHLTPQKTQLTLLKMQLACIPLILRQYYCIIIAGICSDKIGTLYLYLNYN